MKFAAALIASIFILRSSSEIVSPRKLLQSPISTPSSKALRVNLHRLESFSFFGNESTNTMEVWSRILGHDWMRLDTLTGRLYDFASQQGASFPPSSSSISDFLSSPVSFGNGGIYYTDVNLGTPPEKFSLIMDTGSDLTWVHCSSGGFNPQASSSYEVLPCDSAPCKKIHHNECSQSVQQCTYSYGYGDGSTTRGELATETLRMTSSSGRGYESFNSFVFGCGSTTILGEAGLLGLSPGALSFPSQVSGNYGAMFSYCLIPQNEEGRGKRSSLIFGDDAMMREKSMQFTPIVDKSTYFTVSLLAISVGGSRIDFSGSGSSAQPTIFDSGTTLTMLPVAVYSAVKDAISTVAGISDFASVQGLDSCFMGASLDDFPSMAFHFNGGADYVTPPQNYVIDLGSSIQCLAIVPSSKISIIGNVQQQDFLIVHDFGSERIGFMPADCAAMT